MASREDVIVRFGGDKKGVDSTLAQIRTSVAGLSSGISSALGGLGIGLGFGAIAKAVKDTLGWADDLAETADRVGLTTDAIQALRLEAELFGVTAEEVDGALTKFSINLGKARQGTGDLYAIFKQYNQDLGGTATQVLERYIGLLQQAKSEAEQNRIAVAGFGKAGAKMAASIAQSGMPLDQMIAKFREIGLVMEDGMIRETAALADEYDKYMQWMSAKTKEAAVYSIRWIKEWINASKMAGIILSHAASGEFLNSEQAAAFASDADQKPGADAAKPKPAAAPGSPTEEGERKIDDAMKAREAAKDAARLKDMTAAQRQWELESRILRAMNAEKDAMTKKDEEAARKAQELQEETLRKLIADPITPDYIVEKYRKMVAAIEAAPGPNVKLKIEWEGLTELPKKLQDVIMAPGSQYVVPIDVPVRPYIVGWVTPNDPNMGVGKEARSGPYTDGPMTDLIKQANDAVGANP